MPSKKGQILAEVVTIQEVATMFRVSERQVQRLTSQGILRLALDSKGQTVRGRYVLGDVVASYVKQLRDSIADNPQEKLYQIARRRRMEVLAEREELDLMVQKGELHRADHIGEAITTMLTFFRSRMLSIPARVSRGLVGQRDFKKIFETIQDEIHGALKELSESTVQDAMMEARKPESDVIPEEHRVNLSRPSPAKAVDIGCEI